MIRVEIKPELLSWARERARFETEELARRFPKLSAWESGTVKPTLKQVEEFAKATHTPIGFLFLQEPPVEAGSDERFWRLAQALVALYPKGTDERRWIEGVTGPKKGLGF